MKTVYLTYKQLSKLKELHIDDSVSFNEATFYKSPKRKDVIYKIYDTDDDRILLKKESTVQDLLSSKKEIAIPELVLPKACIRLKDRFKGIALDRIKGANLSVFLSYKDFPISFQIKLLKQLGTILQKISDANPSLNLAYGDVHPDNFILCDNKLFGIDTDGMRIHSSQGRINYFYSSPILSQSKKYTYSPSGYIEASNYMDIFCFIMIILQLISNNRFIYRISLDEYKRYLDYLSSQGFDTKLLESFASIYDPRIDNINPIPYLDNLTKNETTTFSGGFYHF